MRGLKAALGLIAAGTTPWFKRSGWRSVYQYLATIQPDSFSFMNYGYEGSQRIALEPSEEPERFCFQLYHHVASAVDVEGKHVLEVGCGRGGGLSYVKKYLEPNRAVGLDLSSEAAALSHMRFGREGLDFVTGDAEALPFASESFDCVLNVESAFCYPSRERFYREVHRVLRKGGHFLYADIENQDHVVRLDRALERAGFTFLKKEIINSCVIKALDLDSDRRKDMIDSVYRFSPSRFASYVFAGVKGTLFYKKMSSGHAQYFCYAVRKVDS